MAVKKYDLCDLVRGDDWTIKMIIKDEDNVPIDVTNNLYWFTVKQNKDDLDPGLAQTYVTADGENSTNGVVFIRMQDTITRSIEPGRYYYDIQEIDGLGNVFTLLLGRVRVVQDITIDKIG